MHRFHRERMLVTVATPIVALVLAFLLTSVVLVVSNHNPIDPYRLMLQQLPRPGIQVLIINLATLYYLVGIAVAIGFRMHLFNIGIDGQYRLASAMAAVVGAKVALPGLLQIPLLLTVAMATGAFWAGIAGVLKITRGISEVVSTIMLNAIASSLIIYITLDDVWGVQVGNNMTTGVLHQSGWVPGIDLGNDGGEIYGLVPLAALLGIGYWFLLARTRFGFDIRATGASETAAVASGVDTKRMALIAMLMSGSIAGLVGLPLLLGASHTFSLAFPSSLGFAGIGIALLGRSHPGGIAIASLLWAFLDKASPALDYAVPVAYEKEIVAIMQGLIVIAVVISYEAVRRWGLRRQQRRIGAELAAAAFPNGQAASGTGGVP